MNIFERYENKVPLSDLKGLMSNKPPVTIRVNNLKTTKEELNQRLMTKGFITTEHPSHEQALIILKEPFSTGATTEYLAGQYIMQDASSMIAVSELKPKPEELILDLTAAPGAKTTHISDLMSNTGTIIAVDESKDRLKSVQFNAERMGCENIIGLNIKGQSINKTGLLFDKVLLDAPCSAEGTLHKNPEVLKRETHYKKIISEQLSLIESAISVLKKGGTLIYSTCTINPDENEEVIKHALNQGMELKKLSTKAGTKGIGLGKTRRLYPHKDLTQGFFIARMVKK